MSFSARVDRDHPICLVILLDQSDSMQDPLAGNPKESKDSAVAEILNGLLYELVLRCVKSPQEGPRPYFAIAVIGYSTDADGEPRVCSALHGALAEHDLVWTPDLASHPLRIGRRPAPSGTGEVDAPVWIEPYASGGTPMCAAFDRAGRIVHRWIEAYPTSFPPIVINVTDGEATDGDPVPWAARLKRLHSADGSPLVFNVHLSNDRSPPELFSSSSDGLKDEYSARLFEMSSELPDLMLEAARSQGFDLQPHARGFGINADLRSIVNFLNVGTAVGKLLR
jgi:hypothetical protein